MLIRLFQHDSICWDGVLVERPGKVCAAPYLLICGRLAPGPETEQGLERGHGLPAPIVAKDEFIKINLKLIAAHAVIGCDQPLLEIPNGAVCQRQHRLRAFAQIDSQGLRARHMLKSGLLQPRKALETVGVYSRTQHYIFFQETEERCTFEIRDDSHSSAPGYAPAFLHNHQDQRGFPSLQLPASPQSGLSPANSILPSPTSAMRERILIEVWNTECRTLIYRYIVNNFI